MTFMKNLARGAVLGLGIAFASTPSQANGPVMDYDSMLSNIIFGAADGSFMPGLTDELSAAFVSGPVTAKLTKAGSDAPLATYTYNPKAMTPVVSELRWDQPKFLKLQEMGEGDFTLSYYSGGTLMTAMDFTLAFEKSGDAFNPKVTPALNGDWTNWALMSIPFGEGDRENPDDAGQRLEFVIWTRGESGGEMDVQLRLDGDVMAEGRHYGQKNVNWERSEFELKYPENKGAKFFNIGDLLARDGIYDVLFSKDGELHAAYQIEVKDGREVYHLRQAADHTPRSEYLIPRRYQWNSAGRTDGFDVVWMQALSVEDSKARFNAGPGESAVAGADTVAGWQWESSGNATRKTEMVLTDAPVVANGAIRLGDEVVVFGTDYPNGIHWMKVGDTERRAIPEGETFSSTIFAVCGRKIVLTRKFTVSVYDTETDTLTNLPEDRIRMHRDYGGNHGNNHLVCDGHLAAVVSRTDKVVDKLSIKVLDLSGPEPVIIPIKNGPYDSSRVDSIAVSASEGMVAIASSNDDAIHYAPVSEMANQTTVSLKDYKNIRSSQIFIQNGGVVYADDKYFVRHLPFGSVEPKLITEAAYGNSGNGYVAANGRLVLTTSEKFGDRYEMAISDLPDRPRVLDGTGDAIVGTSGSLGMAGQGSIAPDGTVFLAGTPSGGIGTGEHLQILDQASGTWRAVSDADGTVFGAIDVVAGQRLAAFKYGGRSDQKIGLITYGDTISVDDLFAAASANATAEAEAKAAAEAEAKAAKEAEEATAGAVQASQQDMAFITAYMQSEQQMAEAFTAAFGEEEGKRKAREMTLQVMKNNGVEHLIPMYEQMMQ